MSEDDNEDELLNERLENLNVILESRSKIIFY